MKKHSSRPSVSKGTVMIDGDVSTQVPKHATRRRWTNVLHLSLMPVLWMALVGHASAASLLIDEGVVVKFGSGAGIVVRDSLRTNRHVTLTSVRDDTVGGQTGASASVAEGGDWQGLRIEDSVAVANLQIDRLAVRFAGEGGVAALQLARDYAIQFLDIAHSTIGIKVVGDGRPTFSGLSLIFNEIGLEATDSSLPTLIGSDISGNSAFGIFNLSSQTVQATDARGGAYLTWWGAASGPNDSSNTPTGTGDKVGPAVNYAPFATHVPLIDCSIEPADGNAAVAQSSVLLALECRNAIKYRLGLSQDLSGTPFEDLQNFAANVTFPLTGPTGNRTIYVEYQAATLNTVSATTTISYQSGAPVVTITAPIADTVAADTTIEATVAGDEIDKVDFFIDGDANSTPIHTAVSPPPYDALWSIAGLADGTQHTILVVATNHSGQTGEVSRTVTVQRTADTQGPLIEDIQFGAAPLTNGTVLHASGTISFKVTDPSNVDSVVVKFDGGVTRLSNGLFLNDQYSISLDLDGVVGADHVISINAADTHGNVSNAQINVVVDLTTPPDAPTVSITAPNPALPITGDTTVTATVTSATNIDHVDFYVDTTLIATVNGGAPYQAAWIIAGYADGPHTLKVVATNAGGQTGQATIAVTVQRGSSDTTGPSISDVRFSNQPLTDGMTVTAPGLLTFQVADTSGVASGAVLVGGTALAGGGLNSGRYSVLLDFAAFANGTYDIMLRATDGVGNVAEQAINNIVVAIPAPPLPVILFPVDGTHSMQPAIAVSGTAQAGTQVQLYLDNAPVGSLINTTFNGAFNATFTLLAEGTHQLSATAENGRGTSARIDPAVFVTYSAPSPSVIITSPPDNATISTDADVSASVVDAVGVTSVTLTVDGQATGAVLTTGPYTWHWSIGSVQDGTHTLGIKAINAVGKSTTATRDVTVQHVVVIPPVQTAYTGTLQPITPQISYGEQAIVMNGSAVDRTTGAAVPNALLKIVLQVGGFQRRIGIATDANGNFSYRYVPQSSDAGMYSVSVIHPDEPNPLPVVGSFSINRLKFSPSQVVLHAARTVASTIRITANASVGSGVSGVHVVAIPANQPDHDLPPGISIDPPAAVDIAAGGSVPIDVRFTASAATGQSPGGTVVLTALDGAGNVRGTIVINYVLSDPTPALYQEPSSLQTGVKQGQQVTETVQLSNRGLLAATNVQVQIVNDPGGTDNLPTWIYLASPSSLGTMDIGAVQAIQVVAAPTVAVSDGVYNVKIRVSSTNGVGGDISLTVAVTQSGVGKVKFTAKDIYTCLNSCDETPGLANALIRIQNEALATIGTTTSATTDANGQVLIPDLATGHYTYIATAPNHATASGRFTVRPGVVLEQDVFLDYELVSFEWSVTETTIQDHYDVTLTATFVTQVRAPVVLIEPASINLPDMVDGEELTGEVTITNYGLVRADHVAWTPANNDTHFKFEYLGDVPTSLEAHQRVTLSYKVTALSQLPGSNLNPLNKLVKSLMRTKSSGGCYGYNSPSNVKFEFICAAGDTRNGSANSNFNKAYGQCSTSSEDTVIWVGTGTGWSYGGRGTESGNGAPMSGGPGCTAICPDCNGGPPGN